jgi:drug/metabolite transporter (DMT)-like permease
MIAMFFQGGPRRILATTHYKDHAIRLCVNLAYTFAFMYAFSMGSLTSIYTLSYTSPFFMIILSALMLKESVGREKWAAVGIGMIGVIIAMRPGTSVFEFASVLVLVGTFLGALNKILMRRLAATEHSLAIAIYPNIVMMLVTFPFLLFSWKAMPLEHWGLFAIVGAITALGQYCIAQALRFTQASVLAPIDYSTFFWVVALDLFWWHKAPDKYTLIGAAVIVASNLYILFRTRREEAKKREATTAS